MWWIAACIVIGFALLVGLGFLIVRAAFQVMDAIDREDEYEPTEHGGRPL